MGARPPSTSPLALTRRARRVDRLLGERYPDAGCELDFRDPFELLVATVLSAQTTDVKVNEITPALFATYPDAVALAGADRAHLEDLIRPTGFFRAKAASLTGLAAALVEHHQGRVPGTMEALVALPGVGRKTANVVLGNAFGVPGLPVDTHVTRVAGRLGLTGEQDAVRIESDLTAMIPKKGWAMFSHRLIFHGRCTCHARRAACGACPLQDVCPSYGVGETDPDRAAALVRITPVQAARSANRRAAR
ncbi:endonuclease III [Cellulomonas bogoriensis]|uniref:Endonuclease III n=1 Tax=Cellulomonas bogoriensis 69B4 = DSM 16987 TaxID=1386082 RepID=A0A0A0C1N0_9CELL|nr:endonuclease III [Cellulomonas bogoriensis]KGM13872.1 endonuclease III [Cellulomonas bogoriensis 69B4 = DSM 16987]